MKLEKTMTTSITVLATKLLRNNKNLEISTFYEIASPIPLRSTKVK